MPRRTSIQDHSVNYVLVLRERVVDDSLKIARVTTGIAIVILVKVERSFKDNFVVEHYLWFIFCSEKG